MPSRALARASLWILLLLAGLAPVLAVGLMGHVRFVPGMAAGDALNPALQGMSRSWDSPVVPAVLAALLACSLGLAWGLWGWMRSRRVAPASGVAATWIAACVALLLATALPDGIASAVIVPALALAPVCAACIRAALRPFPGTLLLGAELSGVPRSAALRLLARPALVPGAMAGFVVALLVALVEATLLAETGREDFAWSALPPIGVALLMLQSATLTQGAIALLGGRRWAR